MKLSLSINVSAWELKWFEIGIFIGITKHRYWNNLEYPFEERKHLISDKTSNNSNICRLTSLMWRLLKYWDLRLIDFQPRDYIGVIIQNNNNNNNKMDLKIQDTLLIIEALGIDLLTPVRNLRKVERQFSGEFDWSQQEYRGSYLSRKFRRTCFHPDLKCFCFFHLFQFYLEVNITQRAIRNKE